ncbi:hypothetical protein [uncultured Kordia sp.]|uniref:hypothetical protein n=1 Tax=uncultured Kordia sp. TaxID=507699 RepID=UPI00261237B0|nr:hypothetical protein [uncultured Kordia sp.]
MATSFELIFENNSNNSGNFTIFQKPPNNNNYQSLAWFSKPANPHTNIEFEWEIEYSVFWSEKTEEKGITITSSQNIPAGLKKQNKVTLTKKDDAYQFIDQTTDAKNDGSIVIDCDSSVEPNQATVGICIAKKAIGSMDAIPNMNSIFTPKTEYWIAFTDIKEGEIIDTATLNKAVAVNYSPGIFKMTAILNADDTWSIAPTT